MRSAPGPVLRNIITVLLALMVVAPATALAQTDDQPVTIRFVACPDGVGDESGPPESGCDIPVPAPESAGIRYSPDNGGPLDQYATEETGVYQLSNADGYGLLNFASPDYNYFTFTGAVEVSRWYGEIDLSGGDNEITVIYWNGSNGLIQPAENSLDVNLFSCENGIDARQTTEGCTPFEGEQPENLSVRDLFGSSNSWQEPTWQNGTLSYTNLPPNTAAAVAITDYEGLPNGHTSYEFGGDIDEIRGMDGVSFLLRNEHRTIDVYLYTPDGTIQDPEYIYDPAGTINLRLAACPANTDPLADDSACQTIADDGTAQFITGLSIMGPEPLGTPNSNGIYSISSPGYLKLWGMEPVSSSELITSADAYHGDAYVYYVEPGTTRDVTFYYMQGEANGSGEKPTEETTTSTLRVTLANCENGSPESGEGLEGCEAVSDDGGAEVFIDGTTTPLNEYPQDETGAYLIETNTGTVSITGIETNNGWDSRISADEIHGMNNLYFVDPGETRDIWVYYTPPEE